MSLDDLNIQHDTPTEEEDAEICPDGESEETSISASNRACL